MSFRPPSIFTTNYTTPTLQSGQGIIENINVTGVRVGEINNVYTTTDLTSYLIQYNFKVIKDDTVRIEINNQTGDTLILPNLTITIKQF